MTTKVTWDIEDLEYKDKGALSGVVTCVHWSVTAKNGECTGRGVGTFEPGEPDPDTFDPLAALTKEEVLSWMPAKDRAAGEEVALRRVNQCIAEDAANAGSGLPWA